MVILFLCCKKYQDQKTGHQHRAHDRGQNHYGFTLLRSFVRVTSSLPTTTRRTRCLQVGNYARITPGTAKRPCLPDYNRRALFTDFPVNAIKFNSARLEDLWKIMKDRIKEHDRNIRLARTQTSPVSEHAHNTGHYLRWDEVKFIDRDPHWYTRRVKEAIHRRAAKNQTAERTTHRNSKDRKAPITVVENQPITAEHSGL